STCRQVKRDTLPCDAQTREFDAYPADCCTLYWLTAMFPERRQTSRKRFHSGLRHGVVFLLALCMGTVAWALSSPDLRSHDDGIYLATAQSLIERGEYRLINLP